MASDIGRRGIPEKLEKDKHRQNYLSQEPREDRRVAAVQNPLLLEKNVEQHNECKRDDRLDEVNVRLCQGYLPYARSGQRKCHDHATTHESSALPIPACRCKRELGDEGVLRVVPRVGLRRIFQRKIRRGGKSGHHHVAVGIDRQQIGALSSRSAEVGGVAQLLTVGGNLHELDVLLPLETRAQRIVGVGKLRGGHKRNWKRNVFDPWR